MSDLRDKIIKEYANDDTPEYHDGQSIMCEFLPEIISMVLDEAIGAVKVAGVVNTVVKPDTPPKWVMRKTAIKAIEKLKTTSD